MYEEPLKITHLYVIPVKRESIASDTYKFLDSRFGENNNYFRHKPTSYQLKGHGELCTGTAHLVRALYEVNIL
jgi:hypothetical protein